MEIVDLVNCDTFTKPFDPIIRKIDRQIGRRAKFVFLNGKIVEQDSSRPTLTATDSDWWPHSQYSRQISGYISEIQQIETSKKQSRIISIADKLNELTNNLQEKRKQAVCQKFSSLEILIERILAEKLKYAFQKLVIELSHQGTDLLARRAIKPNYASVIRYLKADFTAAAEKIEALITMMSKKAAFCLIKIESCSQALEVASRRRQLQTVFESLKKNRENEIRARQADKVMSFVMKLDTYLLLLKFNAFYSLKVE